MADKGKGRVSDDEDSQEAGTSASAVLRVVKKPAMVQKGNKKLRSPLWSYFTEIDVDGRRHGRCTLCAKDQTSLDGKIDVGLIAADRAVGTNRLKVHLEKKHPNEFVLAMASGERKRAREGETASPGRSKQTNLLSFGSRMVKSMDTQARHQKLETLAFATGGFPMRGVENRYYKQMLTNLGVSPMSRGALRQRIIKMVKEIICASVAKMEPPYALASDGWDGFLHKKFIGVSIRGYERGSGQQAVFTVPLALRLVDVEDQETYLSVWNEVLDEFNIDKRFVVSITTDNGSAIRAAATTFCGEVRDLGGGCVAVPCACHTFQLVLKHSLKAAKVADEDELEDDDVQAATLAHCIRKQLRYVMRSGKRRAELEQIISDELGRQEQASQGQKIERPGKLAVDVCTRWDSLYLMLESYYSNKPFLDIMYKKVASKKASRKVKEKDMPPVPPDKAEAVKELMPILKHFHKATSLFSQTVPKTEALVFRNVYFFFHVLPKSAKFQSSSPVVKAMLRATMSKIKKYYPGIISYTSVQASQEALDEKTAQMLKAMWRPAYDAPLSDEFLDMIGHVDMRPYEYVAVTSYILFQSSDAIKHLCRSDVPQEDSDLVGTWARWRSADVGKFTARFAVHCITVLLQRFKDVYFASVATSAQGTASNPILAEEEDDLQGFVGTDAEAAAAGTGITRAHYKIAAEQEATQFVYALLQNNTSPPRGPLITFLCPILAVISASEADIERLFSYSGNEQHDRAKQIKEDLLEARTLHRAWPEKLWGVVDDLVAPKPETLQAIKDVWTGLSDKTSTVSTA